MKIQKYICLFIGLLFFSALIAQPQREANNELRRLFENLNLPPIDTKHFLYDMSAHVVEEVYFSNQCPEPTNTDNWFLQYEEMYYSAYDTLQWDTVGGIFDDVYNSTSGIIPIGIMDFDYYRLKDDALTTDIYFDFDLSDDSISDKPGRPSSPYKEANVFSAAPLVQTSYFTDVTFSIGSHIYNDNHNNEYYTNSNYIIRVNFDDGNGWNTFLNPLNETYTAEYGIEGTKNIEVAIYDDGNTLIKYSVSEFIVVSTHTSPTPDRTIGAVPGLTADVYYNCQNFEQRLDKVLIFVEGYEVLDFMKAFPFYSSQKSAQDYTDMLKDPEVVQLQNFGYDIVMVDFGSTGKAIHNNAMSLIGLIEFLKCEVMSDHQFVVMGHSMGGVISRYALAYMEEYPNPQSCAPAKGHNTRLLITNDSPHQGANIPLSLQHLYRIAFDALPGQSVVNRKIAEMFNVMLDSKGVKDLLIYHIDTKNANDEYTEHSRRTTFMNNLRNLANNGYPEHCKLMALSDGSMSGQGQTKIQDGRFRTANDKLIDMQASTYLRILGFKVMGVDAAFALHTNPNGSGDLLKATVDAWRVKLKLSFWNISLVKTKYSLYNEHIIGNNLIGHGTIAGGIYKVNLITGAAKNTSFNLPPFGSFEYNNSGTGNLDFEGSIGIPWLANGNLSFSIQSDGLYWCFIPVASALDYTPGPFGMDIESEGSYKYTAAATPFDLIVGIPTSWVANPPHQGMMFNRHHRFLRNEGLRIHDTCPYFTNNKSHDVRLINQEVGEDRLYLDNMDLNRTGMYEAQHDIYVNHRNPYYSYPTWGGGQFESTYSKDGEFRITAPNGFGIFKYDAVGSPTGAGFHINPNKTAPTPRQEINDPQYICCVDYTELRSDDGGEQKDLEEKTLAVSVFPNPVQNGEFTVEMDWVKGHSATIQMVDLFGKTIFSETLTDLNPGGIVTFKVNTFSYANLPTGMYILAITDGEEKAIEKVMVNNYR